MGKSGMLKTVRHSILALFVFTFSFTANAHLFEATGGLSTPNGIDGLGSWGAGLTTIDWDVNHPDGCGAVFCETFYTYTFEHPEVNTYEVIIEVHPFMIDDAVGSILSVNSTLPKWELGSFAPTASTPGMPDTIPGIRFWGDSGSTIETISFSSAYAPMWGDFYATDTNAVTAAWNAGFTNQDYDPFRNLPPWGGPVTPPYDGAYGFHILVPGAAGAPVIPIPAAVWLFGSGLIGLIGIARRKKA